MLWILLIGLLLGIMYLPGWYVRRVMARYHRPADRYPGTGAELVRHLASHYGLDELKVKPVPSGTDHYDPERRTIGLSPENHDGRSLTAITVAAHEMGHAIQHADGMRLFHWRQRLAKIAAQAQRIGIVLLIAGPILLLLARVPAAMFWSMAAGLSLMLLVTVVHLVTLPVELDASFRRALPILERGEYLHTGDGPHARKILRAAAWTYVAQSLGALLNLGVWMRILRPF